MNLHRTHLTRLAWGLMALIVALSGCSTSSPNPPPTATGAHGTAAATPGAGGPLDAAATLIPTWTPTAAASPVPSATPQPAITLALDPAAPAALATRLQQLIDSEPSAYIWAAEGEADVTAGFGPTLPLGEWVYAAVAPFATIPDGVTSADVLSAWRGEPAGPFGGRPFLVSRETAAALEAHWGVPAAGVQTVGAADLLGAAWEARPAWAIVPFEELDPRWKVLRVDGLSPLDKPLTVEAYPLALPIGLRGRMDAVEQVWGALGGPSGRVTNRDEGLMTVIAMTGVTALVRATAFEMETLGVTYPGEAVAEVMVPADIAHVSNEVSFAEDCPYPDPGYQSSGLRFCSRDRYIELLESIGVDVVELTGNHVNDWGTAALDHTLGLYADRGWGTFGGGADALSASQPLTMTHNGNTIAFVGCNPVGPAYAWATEESPGAAQCTIESLAEMVAQLAEQVDVVIVGLQYQELYSYTATAQQAADFMRLATAGAAIVNGSQGHHAQGFGFSPEGHLAHYGVGNLFFDQMDRLGTRQMFVDRHVIYAGRYIATDLWTGLIENWARPRPMTEAERAAFLQSIFAASSW
jgi:hypothetical protein